MRSPASLATRAEQAAPFPPRRWFHPLSPLVGLAAAWLSSCGTADEGPRLTVSAASSLSGVVSELSEAFQGTHPGVIVRHNFAASGILEQQIRHGAAVDVFISAAEREMDRLERDRLVDPATRTDIAANRLVLVAPAGRASPLRGFAALGSRGVGRVAIGSPASVPVGAYAQQVLQRFGVWDDVERKAVYTASVRQALTFVESGDVDAAVVYATDAMRSPRVTLVAMAPEEAHDPIVYPAAVVRESADPRRAREYIDFLTSRRAQAILRRHGFQLPAPGGA